MKGSGFLFSGPPVERLTAKAAALPGHINCASPKIAYSPRFEKPAHFCKPFRKGAQGPPAAWWG